MLCWDLGNQSLFSDSSRGQLDSVHNSSTAKLKNPSFTCPFALSKRPSRTLFKVLLFTFIMIAQKKKKSWETWSFWAKATGGEPSIHLKVIFPKFVLWLCVLRGIRAGLSTLIALETFLHRIEACTKWKFIFHTVVWPNFSSFFYDVQQEGNSHHESITVQCC